MLTFYFSGADGTMTVPEVLTAGMVGREVMLEFSPEWENLSKAVVFSNGLQTRNMVFTGNPVTIPAAVLESPLRRLTVGVCGVDSADQVVIPTVRALGPVILPGVIPAGDPSLETELPVWQQILGMIGDMSNLKTIQKKTLVSAVNELYSRDSQLGMYYYPTVSEDGTLRWTNNAGAPNPAPVNIRGPEGQEGKPAYAYACEGGYAGTEDEFGEMLALACGVAEPAEEDIPKVFFGGALPQTKDDTVMSFRYISKTKDISGWCKTKAQGNSSMNYPKKNQTVKLYKDAECTEKLKVDFKGWGKQNKFCFKANWIDLTHARNIVSARLWGDVVKSRDNYDTIPELLRTSPNQGAVDGFPVKVYANGIYQGRYTLNIPKDAWMANMDDELDNHCILCGENYESGCFRAVANIDGSDWTDEVHETVPASIRSRWNEAIRFVINSPDQQFADQIGNYFDVPSLIDYYLFGLASCGFDAFGKNQLYMTYDGLKWYATMYDMDSTWGLWWDGSKLLPFDYARTNFEDYKKNNGNLLYVRLESLFIDEIKERWEELKAGALSIDNIINRFERFTDIAPPYLVAEDYATTTAGGAYTEIPQKEDSNIQQIRGYASERFAYTDNFVEKLGEGALYPLNSGTVNLSGMATATVSGGNHVHVEKTSASSSSININLHDLTTNVGIFSNDNFVHDTLFTLKAGDKVRVKKMNTVVDTADETAPEKNHTIFFRKGDGSITSLNGYSDCALSLDVDNEQTVTSDFTVGCIGTYISAGTSVFALDFDLEIYVNDVRYV